jgi:hypothetical protein
VFLNGTIGNVVFYRRMGTNCPRSRASTETISHLRIHLEQNRIFFSANLCSNIETILGDAHKIIEDIYVGKVEQRHNDNSNKTGNHLTTAELLQPTQTWCELDKKAQTEIKAARLNLAQEFRKLIGVE